MRFSPSFYRWLAGVALLAAAFSYAQTTTDSGGANAGDGNSNPANANTDPGNSGGVFGPPPNGPRGGFGGGGGRRGGRRGGFGGGFGGGGFGGGGNNGPYVRLEGGGVVNEDTVKTARETEGHSVDLPTWKNTPAFSQDTFTFARILFHNQPGARRLGWWVDYPDADINFSFRLQQFTSIKVDPNCRVIRLTDPDLDRYPFIYMEHVEGVQLTLQETRALHAYLLTGGALMVNDTWGDAAAEHFMEQMKLVLPERQPVELTMDHPIFHCIFNLTGPMNKLQVPTMQFLNYDYDPNDPESKPTRPRDYGWEDVHIRAWLDDKQRLMVLFINNSDVSDGWEREGENESYFHLFSEKIAYPLGINIIYYMMTH